MAPETTQRERDRHAERQQDEEQQRDDRGHHDVSSSVPEIGGSAVTSRPETSVAM